jgi:hypothetical protein
MKTIFKGKDDIGKSSLPPAAVEGLAELRTPTANSKVSSSINHHSALSWMQWLANKSKMSSTTLAPELADTTTPMMMAEEKMVEQTTATTEWQWQTSMPAIITRLPYPGACLRIRHGKTGGWGGRGGVRGTNQ